MAPSMIPITAKRPKRTEKKKRRKQGGQSKKVIGNFDNYSKLTRVSSSYGGVNVRHYSDVVVCVDVVTTRRGGCENVERL
jgi:hypothetical protein